MQPAATCVKTKALTTLVTLAWVGGLLAAGSDGPLMPYINVAGALVFMGSSVLLGRLLSKQPGAAGVEADRSLSTATPGPDRADAAAAAMSGIRSRTLHPRFSRELGVI